MPFGAVAAGVSAAATAASAISGLVGSGSASGQQSRLLAEAENKALDTERDASNRYVEWAQPYISTGTTANALFADSAGVNGIDKQLGVQALFQASPGYKYQLEQGLSAIDNGAASRGTLRSGNTIRAEETLGENLANQDFGNYLQRLNSLSSLGANTINALGGSTVSTAGQEAQTIASGGQAQANVVGNAQQSQNNALGQLGNAASGAVNAAGKVYNALSDGSSSGSATGAMPTSNNTFNTERGY